MKKILFFSVLFLSISAFAQMVDLLGSLGVQSALTTGDSQSVSMGMSALKKNKILQDIQQTAVQIKTQYIGNYSSVNKGSIFGTPFLGFDWDIGSETGNLFYIQLNHIDNKICSYLNSARTSAIRVEINGQTNDKNCVDNNQIKFIFD